MKTQSSKQASLSCCRGATVTGSENQRRLSCVQMQVQLDAIVTGVWKEREISFEIASLGA